MERMAGAEAGRKRALESGSEQPYTFHSEGGGGGGGGRPSSSISSSANYSFSASNQPARATSLPVLAVPVNLQLHTPGRARLEPDVESQHASASRHVGTSQGGGRQHLASPSPLAERDWNRMHAVQDQDEKRAKKGVSFGVGLGACSAASSSDRLCLCCVFLSLFLSLSL
eukprot:299229-Rhodomonas_salina.2